MNVNEYGVVFAFFVAYDISGYTTVSITFTKPDTTELTVTNPDVTVPNVPFVTPGITFPPDQYGQYTFKTGDVDQSGTWTARLTYQVAPNLKLISNVGSFVVGP